MTDILVLLTLLSAFVALVLLVVLLKRAPGASEQALERQLSALRGERGALAKPRSLRSGGEGAA